MTKTVFGSHAQTAHVWAQGRVQYGRSSDGRMYFENRTLYSYGSHYALGFVIMDEATDAPIATLLNTDRYSVSTSKHQGHARTAARGVEWPVPALTEITYELRYVTMPGQTKAARKERQAKFRAKVESYLGRYFDRMDDVTAAYILGLFGGTAKQALAIRVKAARLDAQDKARRAKALADARVRDAKHYGALTMAEFRELLGETIGEYTHTAEANRAKFAADLYAYYKAYTAAGFSRYKKPLWAMIQMARKAKSKAVTMAALQKKRGPARKAIKLYREWAANEALPLGERKAMTSRHWDMLHRAAADISSATLRRSPALSLKMDDLANLAAIRADDARELEQAQVLEAWRSGASNSRPRGGKGAYIRATGVERDGAGEITHGELETSLGARVPLLHALKAFRFLKQCHDTATAWEANGRTIRVGHFQIEKIEPNGDFTAGCHFIQWREVDRLAQALGVADWAADDSALVERAHA